MLDVTYFTDPLCCWSWAFERHLDNLLEEYKGSIHLKICMSGLIPSWNNFHDEENSVSRPTQMGPVWMHASQVTGAQMNSSVWIADPPASSYPACIAVKCAQLQSEKYGRVYLNLLRKKFMIDGLNICRDAVIIDTANELQQKFAEFNPGIFRQDLYNGTGMELFKKDLHILQQSNISRFPSMILRREGVSPVLISGYKNYDTIKEIFQSYIPLMSSEKN